MDEKEAERRRTARNDLANKLYAALGFALTADLSSEAAIISKLIEATITNTTYDLYAKLTS